MRILIVEDSTSMRQSIAKALRKSGYAVDEAADGEDGLWRAREFTYDTIVLDLMLPKLNGLEILTRLRETGNETPILLLTARNEVNDRVRGLRSGADDYLGKPFALEEFLARVDVLCRKRFSRHTPVLKVGPLEIDTNTRTASWNGTPLELAQREFQLLHLLALQPGKVLERSEIENHLYDEAASPMSNVVDATIYQVRRKLRAAGAASSVIQTRRGQGYSLEVTP